MSTTTTPKSARKKSELSSVLDAAEAIPDTVRGAQKKKRQAVRRAFASASTSLLIETADLLGLVNKSWMTGSTRFITIDLTKFDPTRFTPEDVGLFLGLKDRLAAAGVNANTVALSTSGHIFVWGTAVDRAEVAATQAAAVATA